MITNGIEFSTPIFFDAKLLLFFDMSKGWEHFFAKKSKNIVDFGEMVYPLLSLFFAFGSGAPSKKLRQFFVVKRGLVGIVDLVIQVGIVAIVVIVGIVEIVEDGGWNREFGMVFVETKEDYLL